MILLVRSGSVIPHANLAQSTLEIDWSHLELKVFSSTREGSSYLFIPGDSKPVRLDVKEGKIMNDPFSGKVSFTLTGIPGE